VQNYRYIIVVFGLLLCFAAGGFAHAKPVMLEIEGGDTAFVVDAENRNAAWVMDTCKRDIPLQTSQKSSLQSQMLRDDVKLGSRQVELRQQFRFNLVAVPASVEVYNSMRGGWSPVPVRVDTTCHLSAECRARMELPECPGS